MAKKNLIIGGFTNYGINQLKPWVLSAKEVADENTDVVLLAGNATSETITWLNEQKVIVAPMIMIENMPPHVLRFLSIYEFLYQNNYYENVVTTDVKDVYFQSSPFDYMEKFIWPGVTIKLIVASEGLRYKDEPWGNQNLYQTYGPYVYDKFKENEIFNVGTFGGKYEYVKDMVFNIFTNAVNRPIPIVDQAVFNVLINTQPFKDVIYKTVDWACEAGTVADPSKIAQFAPNLMCYQPTVKDGIVCYGDKPFPIVHQYDRVPQWKKFVEQKYGQHNSDEYITIRT
jgi:hypothetical protein